MSTAHQVAPAAAAAQPPQVLPRAHAMVLGMVAGGAPLGEVLTTLARLVEDEQPEARCAILGRHPDDSLRVLAAPSLPMSWHTLIVQQATRSADRRSVRSELWLEHPTAAEHIDISALEPDSPPAIEGLGVASTMPVFVDGQVAGAVVVYYRDSPARDATETVRLADYAQLAAVALSRTKSEHQLRVQMSLDSTTGLPNGNDVPAQLEAALERLRRTPGSIMAVISVDLPLLHEYNTTFGFGAGDNVLRFVANALTETVGAGGGVVRTGGGRFLLLIEGMTRPEDVVDLAHQAGNRAAGPVVLGRQSVTLDAVVGVAVAEHGHETVEQLLGEAHAAAAQVRRSTRDRVVVFDPAVARRASDRLVMELGLHRALTHDELVVHYQPGWSISDGRMVAVEALVRWQDPEHGLRGPLEFIGVAEDSGLIRQITRKVLDTACRQVAHWKRAHPDLSLHVSVNISAVELHDPTLITDVQAAIQASGIPAHLLCLELTETAVMTDAGAAVEVMAQLKALGVKLAIDDFGTGYSSLAYLRRLPVDYLKIDRSFISAMLRSREDEAIVAAVISLADTLHLRVIAEGVETADHLEVLREMSCSYGQGFHWSPAVPPDQIERMLDT